VRTYKPKPAVDKDRRMAVAVRLTTEGLSLRQAAARLSVSYQTVARDLERWERERASMPLAIIRLSQPAVTKNAPGATDVTPRCDSGANVIPLRRSA
jgi:predicted DNA-binding protein (UPF0251 family)